jgi:hypothetical protein
MGKKMACILAKETQVRDQDELSTTDSKSQPNIPFHLQVRKTAVHLEYIIIHHIHGKYGEQ